MAATVRTEHPHIVRSRGVADAIPTIAGTRITVANDGRLQFDGR